VLVVGDVNSSLACALVAAKKEVPVVHVEAGLRSFDRRMPEEINRVLIDRLADRLYTTERSAERNLRGEGIDPERICFCGNVMIDALHAGLQRLRTAAGAPHPALSAFGPGPLAAGYGVVTLHRPANVDDPGALRHLVAVLDEVAARVPLVFVLHPRTRARLEGFGVALPQGPRRAVVPPQGYLDMLALLAQAALVLTDSGGVQEETTALGVPCLTLRDSTERPITVEQGTNQVVGTDAHAILHAVDEVLAGRGKRGRVPEFWDGHASQRLAADLAAWLPRRGEPLH